VRIYYIEHYYSPWQLERAIEAFVQHYNHTTMIDTMNHWIMSLRQTCTMAGIMKSWAEEHKSNSKLYS